MSAPVLAALQASDFAIYAELAYSLSFVPCSTDETDFVRSMRTSLARDPTGAELAILRRLVMEAHTFVMADIRSKIERGDDSTPRRLAVPERRVRTEQQANRLGDAISTSGHNEPSYWLIDECEQQREDGVVRWIAPGRCCSRTQELSGEKRSSEFTFNPKSNTFKSTLGGEPSEKADLSAELMVRQAFRRRSLACDQAGLLSFVRQMR